MTPEEAARRLGVAPAEVLGVDQLPAGKHDDGGAVVELANGERMLVTDTTARRYVPDVDGELPDADAGDEPDGPDEPESGGASGSELVPPASPRKHAPARKRAPRKATR